MKATEAVLWCCLAAALPAAPGEGPATVALLPFENLSGVEEARGEVASFVASFLAGKGYHLVQGGPVEQVLEAERVRHLDSLPTAARGRVFGSLGARGVVSGTIYAYADGENPIVSLSVRVLREDGSVAFWNVVGLTADDTEGMFGRGRVSTREALAREATARVLRDLPAPGQPARAPRPRSRPFRLPAPKTFRADVREEAHVRRLCILPFENFTAVNDAPKALGQLLWRRLAESGRFEVVEPADLRAAMVSEGVRTFRDMDPVQLRRLGNRLGTSLFLRGTLYVYREASSHGATVSPQLALEWSLVDVASSRILWTSHHSRKGDDYRFLLQRGALSNAVTLSDQVVSEMVAAEEGATRAATKLRSKGRKTR